MPAEVATADEFADLAKRVDTLEGAAAEPPADPSADLAARVGLVEESLSGVDHDLGITSQALSDLAKRVALLEERPAGPSGTVVGLPYFVIKDPTDKGVQEGIKAWRKLSNGDFPLNHLILGWIGTAYLTTPLEQAFGPGKIQGARISGISKRGTQIAWGDTVQPVLTALGTFRNYRFADWTFVSTGSRDINGHSDVKGVRFRSNVSPQNDTDGRWTDIEWMGPWDYGLALAGDANANENSETGFYGIGLANDASFKTAWLWIGAGGANVQQNQFLNYTLNDSKLEGSHGDYIRADYGGHLSCGGFNSWIHTGQGHPTKTPGGRMIYLPKGSNGDSVMKLTLDNIRAELRKNAAGGTDSVFLDSAWSRRGTITGRGVDLAGNASQVGNRAGATIKLRDDARVTFDCLEQVGHIGLYGKAAPRLVLINSEAPGSQGVDNTRATPSTGFTGLGGIVRTYDSASAANVKII